MHGEDVLQRPSRVCLFFASVQFTLAFRAQERLLAASGVLSPSGLWLLLDATNRVQRKQRPHEKTRVCVCVEADTRARRRRLHE